MAISIFSTSGSEIAQNNISYATDKLNRTMARLSSGHRINSAYDDAAGLQISNRMDSQINGLNRAVQNAQDGISMAQTADGALKEFTSILKRMRDLGVQSLDGATSNDDKKALNQEFTQLKEELNRIEKTTTFGSQQLFSFYDDDGTGGTDAAPVAGGIGGNASWGILDYDATNHPTGGVDFLVGSNVSDGNTIEVKCTDMGVNMNTRLLGTIGTVDSTGKSETDPAKIDAAQTKLAEENSIKAIDKMLTAVGGFQSTLGSMEHRFEHTVSNLQNISTNMTTAQGRIMNTDYATEAANMAQQNIQIQAGTSVLAQAKNLPQNVLSLLR
ncbi:flagellin N-terminal helical domain-containing protein [Dongshaea marina]|uniref:flagellin N-terminal helical domain-containing protein n=1 Tax=Dongshaea marina TaxID=2047966 RepID=UPI000D3EDEEC|nr:flagellin [Dongshaea marina]